MRVFFCSAPEDEDLRRRLEDHLGVLRSQGAITIWHDRLITADQEWAGKVDEELERADIILLLISSDFLSSAYCRDAEVSRALVRHKEGAALVIPILVRPVDSEGAWFDELPCLPSNKLAATLWANLDQAFREVAQGIRKAIEARTKGVAFTALPPDDGEDAVQQRALDAAVPAEVTVGQRTEVLAMVTTTDSKGLRAVLEVDPGLYAAGASDVHTTQFELEFPRDAQGRPKAATVVLGLVSPDFDPPSTTKKLRVPPSADSAVCTLLVTPKRIGRLTLDLEVRLEDEVVWSHRLGTTAAEVVTSRSYVVTQLQLSAVSRALVAPEPPHEKAEVDDVPAKVHDGSVLAEAAPPGGGSAASAPLPNLASSPPPPPPSPGGHQPAIPPPPHVSTMPSTTSYFAEPSPRRRGVLGIVAVAAILLLLLASLILALRSAGNPAP